MAATVMAQALCFISAKGGSGKTVTSSALGTFLSSLGFKILLVDTDAATNGLTLLYLEHLLGRRRQKLNERSFSVGLFEANEGKTPTRIDIDENLHLVPATFTMRDTENIKHDQFHAALKAILVNKDSYDFIFLDAQAGTDMYARIAASFADQSIIVSEYDPVSAQGIERLKVLFAGVINPSSTWTLFNKVLPEFASAIGEGLSIARYLTPIPWDADVVRAFARRDLAINMGTPNPYTLAISQVAFNLFPDETGDAIEEWQGSALKDVTAPVKERLRELDESHKLLLAVEDARKVNDFSMWALSTLAFAAAIGTTVYYYISTSGIGIVSAVLAVLGGGTTLATFIAGRSKKSLDDNLAIKLIDEEMDKLRTTLEATEATFKISPTGYYERRRRALRVDAVPTLPAESS